MKWHMSAHRAASSCVAAAGPVWPRRLQLQTMDPGRLQRMTTVTRHGPSSFCEKLCATWHLLYQRLN
eukprot:12928823-Prorocentrum_lima.AAC.1